MTLRELIQSSLHHLKKIVGEDEVDFSANEVSIAHVSNSSPLVFMNPESILGYFTQ